MSESKRVVVTGATGLIGRALCTRLRERGYAVVVFSRDPQSARQTVPGAAEYVAWSATEAGPWAAALNGAYAVVHLAGANNFARRWNSTYKQEILESRVTSTRLLVEAMRAVSNRPRVFVSGSAIGYYGHRDATPIDESGTPGDDFLAAVVRAWEQEALPAAELGIRTVLLRTGVVIGSDEPAPLLPITLRGASLSRPGLVLDFEGGVLPLMSLPFRLFIGGPIGSGAQWMSWIHLDDEVGLLLLALEDSRVAGPLNATAPEPVTNREFSRTMGAVLGRPSWLPLPGFAMRLMLGEVADVLVTGQRVIPAKAEELGFRFRFPTLELALRDELNG